MDTNDKFRSIQLYTDWSKWLITINFAAATGCVLVLKISDQAAIQRVGPYLLGAILFFGFSLICATLFVLIMADASLKPAGEKISYRWLAELQWVLFVLAVFFVLIWIAILAV